MQSVDWLKVSVAIHEGSWPCHDAKKKLMRMISQTANKMTGWILVRGKMSCYVLL